VAGAAFTRIDLATDQARHRRFSDCRLTQLAEAKERLTKERLVPASKRPVPAFAAIDFRLPIGRSPCHPIAVLIAFDSRDLRTVCLTRHAAVARYGEALASVLIDRLADLRAATSICDIIAAEPRLLPGALGDTMAVDLTDGSALVFCANHVDLPRSADERVDWTRVSRIRLLRIETL